MGSGRSSPNRCRSAALLSMCVTPLPLVSTSTTSPGINRTEENVRNDTPKMVITASPSRRSRCAPISLFRRSGLPRIGEPVRRGEGREYAGLPVRHRVQVDVVELLVLEEVRAAVVGAPVLQVALPVVAANALADEHRGHIVEQHPGRVL